uniref:Uncharacterized protein n=1 Tax=Trichinella nativa TaxID=6335 RepID=A0A0V1KJ08_9BILA
MVAFALLCFALLCFALETGSHYVALANSVSDQAGLLIHRDPSASALKLGEIIYIPDFVKSK